MKTTFCPGFIFWSERPKGKDSSYSLERAHRCCIRSVILNAMKTDSLLLLAVAGCLLSAQDCFSQSGASADAKVSERGQHHRVWQQITVETNEVGQVIVQTNSY